MNKVLKKDARLLNKFVGRLKNKLDGEIKNIILFGSIAKGLSHQGSDYDLIVILVEKKPKVIDELYNEVVSFLIRYGIDISLKIYSEKDFRRYEAIPTPFMAEVKKTGVGLWSQNLTKRSLEGR